MAIEIPGGLTCSECGAPYDKWGAGECPACGVGYKDRNCKINEMGMQMFRLPPEAEFQKANKEKIRETIKALYESKLKAGEKIPNINDTVDEVLVSLRLRGLEAQKSAIKEIADEPKFKNSREPSGVRHNNRGLPRRRRRGE